MIAFRLLLGATLYVRLLIGAPSSDEVSDWLKGLHNADETARLSAAWDRKDFGPSTALPILRKAMPRETPFARRAIVALIGEMRAEPAISIPILIGALDDADEQVRSEAAASLIKFGPEVIGPAISAIRKSAEGSRTAKAAAGNSESTHVNRPAADYAAIVLKQMGRSAIGPAAMALKGATPSQAAYFLAALRHFAANYPSDVVKTLLAFDGARPWRTRLFADLGDVAAAQLRGLGSSADLTLRREADREIGLVYLKRLSNGSIFADTPVAPEVVPSIQALATDKTEAWNARGRRLGRCSRRSFLTTRRHPSSPAESASLAICARSKRNARNRSRPSGRTRRTRSRCGWVERTRELVGRGGESTRRFQCRPLRPIFP